MPNPLKVSRKFSSGDDALQIVAGNGVRVNATASNPSTTEVALPTNGGLLIVRAADAVWLRLGATGVGAAAADANSILFLGGEAPLPVPDGATHFRVLRVGASDVILQLEGVAALSLA
jgi:hypothetical protein